MVMRSLRNKQLTLQNYQLQRAAPRPPQQSLLPHLPPVLLLLTGVGGLQSHAHPQAPQLLRHGKPIFLLMRIAGRTLWMRIVIKDGIRSRTRVMQAMEVIMTIKDMVAMSKKARDMEIIQEVVMEIWWT